MASAQYRIECNHPLHHQLLPLGGRLPLELADRELAVSLAAKNFEAAPGEEIRVVHIPTGEIVFRKDSARRGERGLASGGLWCAQGAAQKHHRDQTHQHQRQ